MNTGVFYVNSATDNNVSDAYLTLREAIMLANGGTGPLGLDRGLSDGELNQVWGAFSGCETDFQGNISFCGDGYPDVIRFSNTLGANPVIHLTSMLPAIDDSASTTLDGSYSNIFPTIDASSLGANSFGLSIGHDNVIQGVRVTGASLYDFNVYGSNNQLTNVAAWKAGQNGIDIRTSGNVVDGAMVGVSGPVSSCSANLGNGQLGISISTNVSFPSAKNNVIKNSFVECNGTSGSFAGIQIAGTGATNNTIGPGNLIGTDIHDVGNTGDGVFISGANNNSVINNTLANNGQNGLYISGSYATQAGGNTIRLNALDGIYIDGNAQNNQIGGPTFGSTLTGNTIGGNGHSGIEMYGNLVRNNVVAGNAVGLYTNKVAADANNFSGIVLDGARNNIIGDNAAAINTISGNKLNGVALYNGAAGNSIAHNRIGLALSNNAAIANVFYGVLIDSGSHDNTLGGNTIDYSGLAGVVIQGSATASNTLTSNFVESSGAGGVIIRGGAFNNRVGLPLTHNTIDNNTGNGIEISGGAHKNVVESDPISANTFNGVWLTGAGTRDNVITGTQLIFNGADGILENNGASYNVWSHLNTGGNGHMGLEVVPPPGYTPAITLAIVDSKGITLAGHVDDTGLFTGATVEGYLVSFNAHGGPEITYWNSAVANANGDWNMSRTGALYAGASTCLVAFETTKTVFPFVFSNSSTLSPSTCRALIPIATK